MRAGFLQRRARFTVKEGSIKLPEPLRLICFPQSKEDCAQLWLKSPSSSSELFIRVCGLQYQSFSSEFFHLSFSSEFVRICPSLHGTPPSRPAHTPNEKRERLRICASVWASREGAARSPHGPSRAEFFITFFLGGALLTNKNSIKVSYALLSNSKFDKKNREECT